MQINEIAGDLFTASDDSYLAHCISQDYKMGMGIAVDFNHKFELKHKLSRMNIQFPDCILVDRVFNLINKEKYWHKPTYESMKLSLLKMKEIVLEKNIKKIAMPKIGCGLDKLTWTHVRKQLVEVFKNTDIEINVYYQPECSE